MINNNIRLKKHKALVLIEWLLTKPSPLKHVKIAD